ncbi:MAG: YggU family protein [Candidatus Riflebacteria bacterium]|nr:YggU family protein [Candidatus Riflebacteria bacterium]
MTLPVFLTKQAEDEFILRILLLPRSSRSEIAGLQGDRLKLKVHAPPVEGAANKEVIKLLAAEINMRKSDITIIRGSTSRQKDLLLKGVNEETLRNTLGSKI